MQATYSQESLIPFHPKFPTTIVTYGISVKHRSLSATQSDHPSKLARFSPYEDGLIGLPLHALHEHRSPPACLFNPISSPRGVARLSFTARIEGAHSDRAASASKKDGLAAPLPPF
jgi:hypothetical protein